MPLRNRGTNATMDVGVHILIKTLSPHNGAKVHPKERTKLLGGRLYDCECMQEFRRTHLRLTDISVLT